MTPEQLAKLNQYILSQPDLVVFVKTPDGSYEIAKLLNLPSEKPTVTVWKTRVPITDVGDNIVSDDLRQLTPTDVMALQTSLMLSAAGVNPTLPDRRKFYASIFPGGKQTNVQLTALWKRTALRGEGALAVGPGTGAADDPANLDFEGKVLYTDVLAARGEFAK